MTCLTHQASSNAGRPCACLSVDVYFSQMAHLPLELFPVIFENILKPSQLATCCLVSKAASSFAIPLLYDRILIYAWHKGAKIRVSCLI